MLKIIYILSTLFIILFVGFIGGFMEMIQSANVIELSQKLHYPLYFFTLLGLFKILGAIALLLPSKYKTLKLLAYSGFAYDFIFASYSHYSINDTVIAISFPLFVLFILFISFLLKDKYTLYKENL
ncbi:MAG: DoxX family protein [Campylobacterales bacterium]|nr:DoxX family protein [Campylobacterales bacterium]